jgi:hypothetical protein
MFDLGKVTFYILRGKDGSTATQYEATVIDFEDRSELLKVVNTGDPMRGATNLQKGSRSWFAVHSCLSEKGILKGK